MTEDQVSTTDHGLLEIIIRQVVVEYARNGIPVDRIGNGWCDNFADDVLERWIGDDWVHREGSGFQNVETGQFLTRLNGEPENWDWDLLGTHWNIRPPDGVCPKLMKDVAQYEPSHVWITTGGRHYDAESPRGEASFFDLMFFRRWLGRVPTCEAPEGNGRSRS